MPSKDKAIRSRVSKKWYSKPENRRKMIDTAAIWRKEHPERYRELLCNWREKNNNYEKQKELSRRRGQTLCDQLHDVYIAGLIAKRSNVYQRLADVPQWMITKKRREIYLARSIKNAKEKKEKSISPCYKCHIGNKNKKSLSNQRECTYCQDRIQYVEYSQKELN